MAFVKVTFNGVSQYLDEYNQVAVKKLIDKHRGELEKDRSGKVKLYSADQVAASSPSAISRQSVAKGGF